MVAMDENSTEALREIILDALLETDHLKDDLAEVANEITQKISNWVDDMEEQEMLVRRAQINAQPVGEFPVISFNPPPRTSGNPVNLYLEKDWS